MTTPNYLLTLRRAIRELEERGKGDLIPLNPLIPHPEHSGDIKNEDEISRTEKEKANKGSHETCGKSGISGKRGGGFARVLDALERRCPGYVEAERWQECVEDARRFLATWGDKAEALGWTAGELFGLHKPPANPHPSYSRLSRYDCTGLVWLLQGRRVIALSTDIAAIQNPNTGNVLTYRKLRKPAYGPLGDLLDDFTRPIAAAGLAAQPGRCIWRLSPL